ncbi:MAG: hypothetical protein J5959_09970 [Butyrivibrio sp.]|nr:hypothetical protein [Butyrivibrio sp.]
MNSEQLAAAHNNMVQWLSDPHELGKDPYKILFAGEFELHEMHYYIFKYKKGFLDQWRVGVSGGFEGDSLIPSGHTFSDMKKYSANTAQQDCIEMIERIRAYWMEQAKQWDEQQPKL